jgi:hypothetical protein
MSNRHHSPSLGRWVEVEEVDVPGVPAKARRRRQEEPFVIVPLRYAEEAAKAGAGAPAIIIFTHLLYLSWKTKSSTVTLSNRDGINRRTKDRVLRNFEAAGLIRVERRNGRSPQVTLLRWRPWFPTCTKTTR